MDGYRFAVRQGSKGFEGDAYQVTRNWSDLLPQKGTRCLLIHGHRDPVVDFDSVQDFARRQGYTLFDFPDGGQLILHTKPSVVFGEVRQFVDSLS